MKYIKLYENFDFDDFDFEEDEEQDYLEVGDVINIPFEILNPKMITRTDEMGNYHTEPIPYRILSKVKNIKYHKGKKVLEIEGKWPLYILSDIEKYNEPLK